MINRGAVNVEIHTQPKNYLGNREMKRAIINHPLLHGTLIISVTIVTAKKQISASDVDWRVISLTFFLNQTLQIRNFTGTQKSLKFVRTYQRK